MKCYSRSLVLSLLFLLAVAGLSAQNRVTTAPQVVVGAGLGFDFVTVITLQNTSLLPCSAQILLHRGSGQTVDFDFLNNGQALTNPSRVLVFPLAAQRLRITPAPEQAGLFQGAARITDECGSMEVAAGYDIVPAGAGAAAPAAGTEAPPEIFNSPSGKTLVPGVVGRAVVDIDPAGEDGLPNTPGLAIVGDPDKPPPQDSEFCQKVVDLHLMPLTPEVCVPFDGGHHTFNLPQVFTGIPFVNGATWQFSLQGSNPEARAEAQVIEVAGSNQFRAVPVTTFNPACDPSGLCLQDDRFKVELAAGGGVTRPLGIPVPIDDLSGFFFFTNPENYEVLVKVLDGCAFNDRFWVFAAATTDVEFTLTVTDTVSGSTKTYDNELGTASPAVTDTSAFATCP